MARKILIVYCYFLLQIFSYIHGARQESETPDCKVYFTFGYVYNTFFKIPESSFNGYEFNMRFLVRAKSDAHILLATNGKLDPLEPVYEIVLGAGKNTFSEIRRARIGAAKSTTTILNLLSGTEVRGFWLRITKDGMIEVGKDGDDAPFIYWRDPSPLPIKYFSFSTWTDVFGKWLYDCNTPGKNDTGTSTTIVKKNLTWTDKLRIDLLKGYDPQVIPKMNYNDRLVVNVKLESHHVELDSKKNEITITGLFGMMWIDEKLKWQPSEYGGIKSIQLIHGEVWRPELVLYNAVDYGVEPLGISGVIVNALGEVAWSPMTKLQAHCKLDLSSWPWDQHMCELKLGFWSLKDFLKLTLLKNETQVIKQRTTSEWKLLNIEAESTTLSTPWFDNSIIGNGELSIDDGATSVLPSDTAISLKVTMKRISNVHTYALLIPLIVTTIMSLFAFGLSPTSTEKIGMQCVCLVITSMFIITVDNSLPSSPDHIPYLIKAYCKSMMMVTVSIASSILVMTIIRQPHYKPPPDFVITLLEWSPLKLLLCLPETNFDGLQILDDPNEEDLTPDNPSHYWTSIATIFDRIAMLFTIICIVHVLVFS